MKKCYIVILNYKRWEDAVECVASVFRSRYAPFTVIVIDNHSGNHSLDNIISALYASPAIPGASGRPACVLLDKSALSRTALTTAEGLVLVQNDRNAGFAGGNNIVLSLLKEEDAYIWLLNPDMTVQENTLGALMHVAGRRAIAGAVLKSSADREKVLMYGGGKVNYWSGTISFIEKTSQLPALEYISGGSMLVHASAFNDVGLLPEDYFLYWEESDWCYAALKKGYTLQVSLDAVCYDKVSTTIGRGFLSDYFYTRNGLLFIKKYKPWGLPTALSLVIFRVIKKLLAGEAARAKGVIKGTADFLTNRRYENQ